MRLGGVEFQDGQWRILGEDGKWQGISTRAPAMRLPRSSAEAIIAIEADPPAQPRSLAPIEPGPEIVAYVEYRKALDRVQPLERCARVWAWPPAPIMGAYAQRDIKPVKTRGSTAKWILIETLIVFLAWLLTHHRHR